MRHVLCHIILSAGICKLRRGCESLQEHRYEQSHVWSTRRLHSSDIECPPQIVAAPFPNYVLRHDLAEGESLGTSRLVCVTAHLLLNVSRSHLILAHTILDLAGFFFFHNAFFALVVAQSHLLLGPWSCTDGGGGLMSFSIDTLGRLARKTRANDDVFRAIFFVFP